MTSETEIKNRLLQCWSLQSSTLWTSANPSRGQCGVTALVIHDNYGGEIYKTKLRNGAWHYYNQIEGKRFDFTDDQFVESVVYENITSTREEAFSDTNKKQYKYLSSAYKKLTESFHT